MPTVKRLTGAVLFVYALLYTMQVIFSSLYEPYLQPTEVWQAMNFCTAVGIIIAVVVVSRHKRSFDASGANAVQYLAVQAGFYATLALAIWFFTVWFRLLTLSAGESVSESDNVAWHLVSALTPLVLGTTGAFLWKPAAQSKC